VRAYDARDARARVLLRELVPAAPAPLELRLVRFAVPALPFVLREVFGRDAFAPAVFAPEVFAPELLAAAVFAPAVFAVAVLELAVRLLPFELEPLLVREVP
jgi:hypothetical protein